MNIVILTGGTGSIALQRGLYHALEKEMDGIDVKIVVNAYDNGLSTGAVRSVMRGHILGPSDVRKNQTTRLRLVRPADPWLKFLDIRFTSEVSSAHDFCIEEVTQLITNLRDDTLRGVLLGAIDEFFKQPAAKQIEYESFSLANIIYAGLARSNGDSLRVAGRIMADALDIADNVLLNDDRSLFLGAVTRSGRRIADEGDIVCWGSETDPFVDVFFVDAEGREAVPELCFEAWHAIVEADLVILSSGTQWSSLIPTYASRGFKAAIRDSRAKVVMVMNRTPDKDSPGLTASDMVEVLVPRYFDSGRLHVLADNQGHASMCHLSQAARLKVASFTQADLSAPADPPDKHNSAKLVDAIGYVFFEEYLHSNFFLFDYDDTLFGREKKYSKSSRFNIKGIARLTSLTDMGICTGNTIRALDLRDEPGAAGDAQEGFRKPIVVFADGGVNEYAYGAQSCVSERVSVPVLVRCIAPDALLPDDGQHSASRIITALIRAGIPASKIDNRGNAIIAIKPIEREQRRALISLARNIVYGSDLEVRERGRTTVEICKRSLSKLCALQHLCNKASPPTVTYVGDECESGNDYDIHRFATESASIKCLHVDSPAKTAFFISTLISHFDNVER